jgi:hypothetical protein
LQLIPAWVPEAARRRLGQLMSDPSLRDDARALLERLATRESMRTEVWDRLPSEPAGVQDQIIHCAYYSVTLFSAIIPTPLEHSWPPKRDDLKKWSEIVHERPRGTSFDYTA